MKRWVVAGAAVLVLVAAVAGVVVLSGADRTTAAAQAAPANTAQVTRGELAAMVSLHGTLTYRARPDGSPYSAINQARGIYTRLPEAGDKVGCGDVLYRVDDHPVLLLCGTVPAYRGLAIGDTGNDVRQLNRNVRVPGDDFTWKTEVALRKLRHRRGFDATGGLDIGDAIFLPGSVRIANVTGRLGASARPSTQVAQATSDTLEVQVALAASQQGEVRKGDRAQITLPGNRSMKGKVQRLGKVARTAGKDDDVGTATISAFISLDDPGKARGLDRAPVQLDIATEGVKSALSVPVTALVGKAGGGFAVEVVRGGGRRGLVAVKLGLFDTAGGRVEVDGDLRAGDHVVVPSP